MKLPGSRTLLATAAAAVLVVGAAAPGLAQVEQPPEIPAEVGDTGMDGELVGGLLDGLAGLLFPGGEGTFGQLLELLMDGLGDGGMVSPEGAAGGELGGDDLPDPEETVDETLEQAKKPLEDAKKAMKKPLEDAKKAVEKAGEAIEDATQTDELSDPPTGGQGPDVAGSVEKHADTQTQTGSQSQTDVSESSTGSQAGAEMEAGVREFADQFVEVPDQEG